MLQQQEELIEDEEEQEQKAEDARRAKREAHEQEIRTARSLLPDSEVYMHMPHIYLAYADPRLSSNLRSCPRRMPV